MTEQQDDPTGVSWAALNQVYDIAARVLHEHTPVNGHCPICGTGGACKPARVAMVNFEMAGGSAAHELRPRGAGRHSPPMPGLPHGRTSPHRHEQEVMASRTAPIVRND